MNVAASKGPTIPQRSFVAAEWRLVTMGTMPARDPNDDEDNDAEPDTIASRRLSENPTKPNKHEGSRGSSPAQISGAAR